MYKIVKRFDNISASHILKLHDGKCSNLHGHNYVVEVEYTRSHLIASGPKTNMVVDFSDISTIWRPLLKQFDHNGNINDIVESDSPTAEMMAEWLYHRAAGVTLPGGATLAAVRVWETNDSYAEFRPDIVVP